MKRSDWENYYIAENTPWEDKVGDLSKSNPHGHLIKLIDEYKISPCNVLEVGCGRGSTSRELAKCGFKVKGIDISPKAIECAKFESRDFDIEFEAVDFLKTKSLESIFDLIVDIGCFHYTLNRNFVKKVFDHLHPDGLWYTSVGSSEDKDNISMRGGVPDLRPPAHSLEKIVNAVKPFFVIQDVIHHRYSGDRGFYFYSVFLNRRG